MLSALKRDYTAETVAGQHQQFILSIQCESIDLGLRRQNMLEALIADASCNVDFAVHPQTFLDPQKQPSFTPDQLLLRQVLGVVIDRKLFVVRFLLAIRMNF